MKLTTLYQQLSDQYGDPRGGEQVHAFSDKGNPHTYIEFYESQFEPLQARARILEIGVKTGGSLLLWSRYFAQYRIVGVDLSPTWSAPRPFQTDILANPNIELIWSQDSTQPIKLEGNFDFVIDDGAHDLQTQWQTFENCWNLVRPMGTYYIEDVESEHNAQELIRRIESAVGDSAVVTRYIGRTHQRADDQIVVVQRQ